jgi:hypothetical protein
MNLLIMDSKGKLHEVTHDLERYDLERECDQFDLCSEILQTQKRMEKKAHPPTHAESD